MSDDRKTISVNRARITRPVAAQPRPEDDTDENHPVKPPSVQRVVTPADEKLRELVERIRAREDAALPEEFFLALDRVAQLGAQERESLHEQLAAYGKTSSRWKRIIAAAKAIGFGAIAAALGVVVKALIAHGDAAAMARLHLDKLSSLSAQVEKQSAEIMVLRAQAAGHDSIIKVFAARLSTAPSN